MRTSEGTSSMAGTLTLWGAHTSRAMRAVWAATELGLDFEHRAIGPRTGETQTPEYLALNPKGKIPVLVHGDLVLSESAAIVNYLFEAFAAPAHVYVPATTVDRARLDEWCYFIMTELDAHSLYLIRRHDSLSDIYGTAPEAVASAREYFSKQVNAMAPRVEATGPYLMGERVCCADILMTTTLVWAQAYGFNLPAPLADYAGRVSARPQYLTARKINSPN